MRIFSVEVIDSIKKSVCGIAISSIDPALAQEAHAEGGRVLFDRQIVGTGFVVEDLNRGDTAADITYYTKTDAIVIAKDQYNNWPGYRMDLGFWTI